MPSNNHFQCQSPHYRIRSSFRGRSALNFYYVLNLTMMPLSPFVEPRFMQRYKIHIVKHMSTLNRQHTKVLWKSLKFFLTFENLGWLSIATVSRFVWCLIGALWLIKVHRRSLFCGYCWALIFFHFRLTIWLNFRSRLKMFLMSTLSKLDSSRGPSLEW